MIIPKIIHQIWLSKYMSIPPQFTNWGLSWKALNPDYQYIFWDDLKIDFFLNNYFGNKKGILDRFPYDIQKCDILKYLILYVYGGIYADFDSKCVKNLTPLLDNKTFYITSDPHYSETSLNNSFIASVPKNEFVSLIIDFCFEKALYLKFNDRINAILNTTGPKMLNLLYEGYPTKEQITILHYKYTSPLTQIDSYRLLKGSDSPVLQDKIKEAFVIHYFMGTWVSDEMVVDCFL